MLPEILSSSYKRYKEDTNVFTTWLTSAAKSCGYSIKANQQKAAKLEPQSEVPKAPKLKGRERKLAREAAAQAGRSTKQAPAEKDETAGARYTISTSELLRQAEAVASWSKRAIRLPPEVQRVLERAIAARQRCADWFQKTKVENEYSSLGHLHFIEVLQRALDLLRAAPADKRATASQQTNVSPPTESIDCIADANALNNRFAALEVDEVENYDLTVSDITTSTAQSGNKKPQPTVAYDLEVDEHWEATFVVYCFFEDLHQLQNQLRKLWTSQKENAIDLITATVTTTAAFELLAQAEKGILEQYRSHFHYKRSYENLTLMIFYAESIRIGEDLGDMLHSAKALKVTPFDEFVYLPTARVLMKYASLKKVIDGAAWPPPVPPMRFNYIIDPDLLETPRMKKYEEEDKLLSQLLLDITMIDDFKRQMKQIGKKGHTELTMYGAPPVDDILSNYMRELWKAGEVSATSVFAARLWLDIIDVNQGAPNTTAILTCEGETVQSAFGFHVDDQGVLDTAEGVRWLAKDNHLLLGIHAIQQRIQTPTLHEYKRMMLDANPEQKSFSLEDPETPAEIKEELRKRMEAEGRDTSPPEPEHVENAKRMNIRMIRPNEDMNFAINYNPFLSGTIALDLMLKVEEAGIALANHHLSIFATAHLYNALRQHQLTDVHWPAMERIIDLHMVPLFAGELPRTPQAMYSRLELRIGRKYSRSVDQKQKWKMHVSANGQRLRQLLDDNVANSRVLYQLEEGVQQKMLSTERMAKQVVQSRQLSPSQFISQLSSFLPAVIPDVRVDYIKLTRTCNSLMKKVRERVLRELGILHPSLQQPGESNDHGNLYMVLAVLNDNKMAATAHEGDKSKRSEAFGGGREVGIAGKALVDYLGKHHRDETSLSESARSIEGPN